MQAKSAQQLEREIGRLVSGAVKRRTRQERVKAAVQGALAATAITGALVLAADCEESVFFWLDEGSIKCDSVTDGAVGNGSAAG